MPLSRPVLVAHLVEQLQFLDASCAAFDAGAEIEAKRLAVSLRVLLHDTASSHSVLGQLGEKDKMRFPSNLLRDKTPELALDVRSTMPGLAVLGVPLEGGEPGWEPFCVTAPLDAETSTMSFEEWWKPSVMFDGTGHGFSRRNFVLIVSNKHGGAHVDASGLPQDFADLTAGSIGWVVDAGPVTASPAPSALRQIAEEARHAIRSRFGAELGVSQTAPETTRNPQPQSMYVGGMSSWRESPLLRGRA